MEHDEHSSISNSGNLSVQSSPFVYGVADVPASSEKLSSSSSSSSSLGSPLDNPFGEDDKELGNKNDESFKMQSSPAVDGVDFQASSKKSRFFSTSSMNDDLEYEEERRDTSVGSLPMQPFLALDGVDDQGLSKESRSSSPSSSSSSDSLFDGHFGFDEELIDKNSESLMMQSFPSTLGVDLQDSSKNSRSSTDRSPSLDSPLDGPFRKDDEEHGIIDGQNFAVEGVDFQDLNQKYRSSSSSSSPDSPFDRHFGGGDEGHDDRNIGILMVQSSHTVDGVDIQVSSKNSRSSSTSSSSPDSPLNGLHRNKNVGNLMMQSSPGVDGIDVQSQSKTSRSRSSSTGSSLDFPLNGPSEKGNEESRDTSIENLVPQSSPDGDGVDLQTLRKTSRSSSSSSSSPDSPLNDLHRDSNTVKLTMQSSSSVDRVDVQSPREPSRSTSSSPDSPFNGLHRNKYVGNMQSSPGVDGIDVRSPSKTSRSSSTSSSPDFTLNGPFGEGNEESRDTSIENLVPQSSPDGDGVDLQTLRKTSRSSSSSSSSPNSPLNNLHRDSNTAKLTMQSSSSVDRVDVQSPRKTSRSSSTSSSPDSPLKGQYGKGNEESRDANIGNLIMQSSPNDNGVDVQALRKASRSSSTSSSSSDSPLNDSRKNTNTGKLTVQSSPCVDGVDVEAQSNTSRPSSSTSSSKDSPLNGPFKDGNEETRNASIGNVMMQSSPGVDNVQVPSKTSRSSSTSSSSSDSSHDDALVDKSAPSTTSLPELNHKAAVEDGKQDNPVSRNSPSKNELPISIQASEVTNHSSETNLTNMSTTDSPPTQVMERTTNSKYRIPSHVFARTKSSNPVDWSVASNESLFSIHMGNMSFTRDQLFLKQEELGIPGESSSASRQMVNHSANPLPGEPSTAGPGHMFNYSSNQHPGNKATNGESQGSGIAAAAVETMKTVLRENETDNKKNSIAEGQISHRAAESAASNKSFAFPM